MHLIRLPFNGDTGEGGGALLDLWVQMHLSTMQGRHRSDAQAAMLSSAAPLTGSLHTRPPPSRPSNSKIQMNMEYAPGVSGPPSIPVQNFWVLIHRPTKFLFDIYVHADCTRPCWEDGGDFVLGDSGGFPRLLEEFLSEPDLPTLPQLDVKSAGRLNLIPPLSRVDSQSAR